MAKGGGLGAVAAVSAVSVGLGRAGGIGFSGLSRAFGPSISGVGKGIEAGGGIFNGGRVVSGFKAAEFRPYTITKPSVSEGPVRVKPSSFLTQTAPDFNAFPIHSPTFAPDLGGRVVRRFNPAEFKPIVSAPKQAEHPLSAPKVALLDKKSPASSKRLPLLETATVVTTLRANSLREAVKPVERTLSPAARRLLAAQPASAVRVEPKVSPKLTTQVAAESQTSLKTSTIAATSPQAKIETIVEEVARDEVKKELETRLKPVRSKLLFVKDMLTNRERFRALKEAIAEQKRKKGEKEGRVNLQEAALVLQADEPRFNSGIKKNGPDGSKERLIETLSNTEYADSEEQAAKQALLAIEENTAVDLAEDGEKVGMDKVENVLTFRRFLWASKSILDVVLERVIKTLTKEKIQLAQSGEVSLETTNDDKPTAPEVASQTVDTKVSAVFQTQLARIAKKEPVIPTELKLGTAF